MMDFGGGAKGSNESDVGNRINGADGVDGGNG
jgi:hypothetical protein